jgi:hypothetical protein
VSSSSRNVIHVPAAASRPAFAASGRDSGTALATKRTEWWPICCGAGGCAGPLAATTTASTFGKSCAPTAASALTRVGRAVLRTMMLTSGFARDTLTG